MELEGRIDAELQASRQESERLRAENQRLKELLAKHSIPFATIQPNAVRGQCCLPDADAVANVVAPTDKAAKVALFRSLFRGREDVYAIRWRMKDGKWGYRPDDKKDWNALLASRPEDKKKVDRQTRTFFPLTDEVRLHLGGKKTGGVYPLLTDETCWFLAADFDKATWREDALAFAATCQKLGIPAYLERSRSGNGGHVWMFFEYPTSAVIARKLGCAILTRTMEKRHHLGLDSYDRFFPNQDTMPQGGFGNLIALPLQWVPRQNDNSVFVDGDFRPYKNQWQLLASARRIGADQIDWIVNDAVRRGQVIGVRASVAEGYAEEEPWTLLPSRKKVEPIIEGTCPESIELVRGNSVYVPKADLPEPMLNRIIRLAAFQNPEFYKTQAMRLSTWDKPRIISCAEEFAQHIALPRGCLHEVQELLEAHGTQVSIRDERHAGVPIDVAFQGTLRDEQAAAVRQALQNEDGVLCAPTAFGKTVVASKLIAERRVSTLILVHRRQLLDQWRERLAVFLSLPPKAIGHIAAGKAARTGIVDVALLQSLQRKGVVKDFVAEYGHVIVDECHHLSAVSFEQVMRQVKAKYVVGLTATPTRKDGHHPIIFMQCGPIRFNLSARDAAARSPFRHVVVPKQTSFRAPSDAIEFKIHDAWTALTTDAERNQLIVSDILDAIARGRTPLVLTHRTEHLERLAAALSAIQHVVVMKGGMGKKQRRAAKDLLASIPEGVPRVILATGSHIGEGFDDPRLDTLFLTMPVSWRGTLQQYVGRLHRIHEGKKIVQVYDYVDSAVPMLARMFEKRLRGYRAIGYEPENAATSDPDVFGEDSGF